MPIEHEDSNFVSHEPCDKCGSRDGNSRWSDGHLYCFVCETYTPQKEKPWTQRHYHHLPTHPCSTEPPERYPPEV